MLSSVGAAAQADARHMLRAWRVFTLRRGTRIDQEGAIEQGVGEEVIVNFAFGNGPQLTRPRWVSGIHAMDRDR